jgi:negative regulator of flagellin synthesis FlgM
MKVTDTSEIKRFAPSAPADTLRPSSTERTGTEDRVSTEESASVAAAVAQATQSAAGSRAAKLEAIAAAVTSGTYRPDPQRIAQEILDDAELAAKLQAIFGR